MNLCARFVFSLAVVFSIQLHVLSGQIVSSVAASQVSVSPQEVSLSSTGSLSIETTVQMQNTVLAFQQEQDSLATQFEALVAGVATPLQIRQWAVANASQIQAQAQRAQTMSVAAASLTPTTTGATRLSDGPSSTAADFVAGQTSLSVAFVASQKLALQTSSISGGTATQANLLAVPAFLQQNATLLNQQSQRALALAATSVQQTPTLPISPVVPAGASPQVAAYLNDRNQLRQGLAQFESQYATANPALRAAALAQWRVQNAALMQQLQSEAQTLTQASEQN